MAIELGLLPDQRIAIVTNEEFPADVQRVEYYRDQRLFMLVYSEEGEPEDELMHYELREDAHERVVKAPDAFIVAAVPGAPLCGYDVPLVQIGV